MAESETVVSLTGVPNRNMFMLAESFCSLGRSRDKTVRGHIKLKSMFTNAKSLVNKIEELELVMYEEDFYFVSNRDLA